MKDYCFEIIKIVYFTVFFFFSRKIWMALDMDVDFGLQYYICFFLSFIRLGSHLTPSFFFLKKLITKFCIVSGIVL